MKHSAKTTGDGDGDGDDETLLCCYPGPKAAADGHKLPRRRARRRRRAVPDGASASLPSLLFPCHFEPFFPTRNQRLPNNVAKRRFETGKVTFPLRGEERCGRRGMWSVVLQKWGAKGAEGRGKVMNKYVSSKWAVLRPT